MIERSRGLFLPPIQIEKKGRSEQSEQEKFDYTNQRYLLAQETGEHGARSKEGIVIEGKEMG